MMDGVRYRRGMAAGAVEWGDLEGRAVALPMHFHAEDQVTFVLSGRRRFLVGPEVVTLGPGDGVALPAGTMHASFCEPSGVVCRNLYIAAATVALPPLVEALTRRLHRRVELDDATVLDLIESFRVGTAWSEPANRRRPDVRLDEAVLHAADCAGMSREGFSRAFRREHGLPPCRYRALASLNAARALLRTGLAPAAVSAEAGFADQSHLGREFRRVFGVTPGRYRAGVVTFVPDPRPTPR